jgi:hypothetical protein
MTQLFFLARSSTGELLFITHAIIQDLFLAPGYLRTAPDPCHLCCPRSEAGSERGEVETGHGRGIGVIALVPNKIGIYFKVD